MSQQLSKWWFMGPPFAIGVSLLAYYAVFPSFRGWVDGHFPWAASHIGIYLPARDADEQFKRRSTAVKPMVPVAPTPAPAPPPPARPPAPVYLTADGGVDLEKLAANRADWPKAVVLRKAKGFPAVVDGKAVGSAILPKGTEVHLLKIEAGKLGLEYRGGGAWADVDETDLADRMRSVER
jgi:hypothetical protein